MTSAVPPDATASTALASPQAANQPQRAIFFSLSDRIGRVRYLVYTLSALLALGIVLIVIYLACLMLPETLAKVISAVAFILVKNIMFPLVVFVMSIRRLHDLNLSGWWSLAILIPFSTLILLLAPGQPSHNRFGAPDEANSRYLFILAVLLPVILMALYRFGIAINPSAGAGESEPTHPGIQLRNYPAQ